MVTGDELFDQLDEASKRVHGSAAVVVQLPSGALAEIDRVTVRNGRAVLILARGAAPRRDEDGTR